MSSIFRVSPSTILVSPNAPVNNMHQANKVANAIRATWSSRSSIESFIKRDDEALDCQVHS